MISEKFREVWPAIRGVEGWLPKADASFLYDAACAAERLDGVIVEIGAYKGRSAVTMGFAGSSDIYSVDPFKERTLQDGSIVPFNITDFATNIKKAGLEGRVNPIVMTSKLARDHWTRNVSKPIKLLFIDGDHSYEHVCEDYELWNDLVIDGGWIIFHDYEPGWPGVVKFVDELAAKLCNIEVVRFGACAGFQKRCEHAVQAL